MRKENDVDCRTQDSEQTPVFTTQNVIKNSSKDMFLAVKDSYEHEPYDKLSDQTTKSKKSRKIPNKSHQLPAKRSVKKLNSMERFNNCEYIPCTSEIPDMRESSDVLDITISGDNIPYPSLNSLDSPVTNKSIESIPRTRLGSDDNIDAKIRNEVINIQEILRYVDEHSIEAYEKYMNYSESPPANNELKLFGLFGDKISNTTYKEKPKAIEVIKKLVETKDMYRECAMMQRADTESYFIREALKTDHAAQTNETNKRVIKMIPNLTNNSQKKLNKELIIQDVSFKSFKTVQDTEEDESQSLSPSKFFDTGPTKRLNAAINVVEVSQNNKVFTKRNLSEDYTSLQTPKKYELGFDIKLPIERRIYRPLIKKKSERPAERAKLNIVPPERKATQEPTRFEKFKQKNPEVIDKLTDNSSNRAQTRDNLNFSLPYYLGKSSAEDIKTPSPVKKPNVSMLNKLFSLKPPITSHESSQSIGMSGSSSPNGGKFARYLDRLK